MSDEIAIRLADALANATVDDSKRGQAIHFWRLAEEYFNLIDLDVGKCYIPCRGSPGPVTPEYQLQLSRRALAILLGAVLQTDPSGRQGLDHLGEVELSLLRFAYRKHKAGGETKFLSVIGAVGAGKTTLIRYTLGTWARTFVNEKRRLHLIHVDCLRFASNKKEAESRSIKMPPAAWLGRVLERNLAHLQRGERRTDTDYDLEMGAERLDPIASAAAQVRELSKQEIGVIIAVDNTDQTGATVVSGFLDAAQRLSLMSGATVCFSVRDGSYQRASVLAPAPGPILGYVLKIYAAPLAAVMRSRFQAIQADTSRREELDRLIVGLAEGTAVTYNDTQRFVDYVISSYLTNDVAKMFELLSNYNIRRALALVLNAVQNRDLNIDYLVTEYKGRPSRIDRWGRLPDYIVIRSAMLSQSHWYSCEEPRLGQWKDIPNLLAGADGCRHAAPGLLILGVIKEAGGGIALGELFEAVARATVTRDVASPIVRRLLGAQLLDSPEHFVGGEPDVGEISWIRITDCGLFYLEKLARHHEYLGWTALDRRTPKGAFTDVLRHVPGGTDFRQFYESCDARFFANPLEVRVVALAAAAFDAMRKDEELLSALNIPSDRRFGLDQAIVRCLPGSVLAQGAIRLITELRSDHDETSALVFRLDALAGELRLAANIHKCAVAKWAAAWGVQVGPLDVDTLSVVHHERSKGGAEVAVRMPQWIEVDRPTAAYLELRSPALAERSELPGLTAVASSLDSDKLRLPFDVHALRFEQSRGAYVAKIPLMAREAGECGVSLRVMCGGAVAAECRVQTRAVEGGQGD